MNVIGCLDTPTSGRFIFSDREVSGLTDDELSVIRNEHIGFVFQNFYLLPYATVLENVLLPSLYVRKKKKDAKDDALEILSLVGLKDRTRFKPSQLSGASSSAWRSPGL